MIIYQLKQAQLKYNSTTNNMQTQNLLRYGFSLASNFAILGLKTTTRLQQVKKKYYELAKMYHPDVNKSDQNAHKKFTQITKAYKYVCDNYDKEQGVYEPKIKNKSQDQPVTDKDSQYKNQKRQKTRMEQQDYQNFHDYDMFFKHSKKFRKPRIGQNIYINLSITLQESIMGSAKYIQYTRYEPCSDCAKKTFSACFSCGGKGQIYDRVNRQKVSCENCSGKGFKNDCITCLGASYILREVKQKLFIQKGTQDKAILKVQKKGHSGYKAGNGDLFVTVLVEQSNKFKIDGNNVIVQFDLDFTIATCGGKASVQTVYGYRQISIEPGTQSGTELRMFNAGLKSPFSKRFGDQIVKIKIKIPQKLNEKQKQLMQKLYQLQC